LKDTFFDNFENDLYTSSKKKTSKSTIAGILLILSGFIGIFMWLSLAAIEISSIEEFILPELDSLDMGNESGFFTAEYIKDIFVLCGTIGFFISLFEIIGGILAIKKQMWSISLISGFMGIFVFGFFLSSIFSIIGLLLLLTSREEFS
jgi:hypothetical protein